jgi:hypothetical protein
MSEFKFRFLKTSSPSFGRPAEVTNVTLPEIGLPAAGGVAIRKSDFEKFAELHAFDRMPKVSRAFRGVWGSGLQQAEFGSLQPVHASSSIHTSADRGFQQS